VIASGIQPLQNLIVLIYVGEEKKKEWAQHWINRGFRGRLSYRYMNKTGASYGPQFLGIQKWFYCNLAKLKLQESVLTWNIDKCVFSIQRLKSCCLRVLANTVLVMKYQLLTAASFHKCSMLEGKTRIYSWIDVL
jgi:hypothetical protein